MVEVSGRPLRAWHPIITFQKRSSTTGRCQRWHEHRPCSWTRELLKHGYGEGTMDDDLNMNPVGLLNSSTNRRQGTRELKNERGLPSAAPYPSTHHPLTKEMKVGCQWPPPGWWEKEISTSYRRKLQPETKMQRALGVIGIRMNDITKNLALSGIFSRGRRRSNRPPQNFGITGIQGTIHSLRKPSLRASSSSSYKRFGWRLLNKICCVFSCQISFFMLGT